MTKTAENCGGRSGARSPDPLGVNDCDRRQIRRLVQTAKRRFPDNRPFRSVCVPDLGTERTTPVLTVEEVDRVWGDFTPAAAKPRGFPRAPKGHVVYFIGGETGPVKIGFTQQSLKARIVCIQNGSPIKLRVLATRPGTREIEKAYHRRFGSCRLHGEWFERTAELQSVIDWINEVNAREVKPCPMK